MDQTRKAELMSGVVRKDLTALRFCKRVRLQQSRFSLIVNGHVQPTEAELKILRRELGDDVVARAFRDQVEETQPAA